MRQFRHGLGTAACFQFSHVALYLVINLVMQGRLALTPLAGLVLARVAPAQAGAASRMLNTVQQASGAIGVTATGLAYAAFGREWGLWLLGSGIVGTAVLPVRWEDPAE